jgi:hypothetical protein
MDCTIFAVHNDLPGSDHELIIWGKCHAPRPGYEISLEEDNAGINPDPDEYVMKLVVHEPTVPSAEVVTETEIPLIVRKDVSERSRLVVRGAEPSSFEIRHLEK